MSDLCKCLLKIKSLEFYNIRTLKDTYHIAIDLIDNNTRRFNILIKLRILYEIISITFEKMQTVWNCWNVYKFVGMFMRVCIFYLMKFIFPLGNLSFNFSQNSCSFLFISSFPPLPSLLLLINSIILFIITYNWKNLLKMS